MLYPIELRVRRASVLYLRRAGHAIHVIRRSSRGGEVLPDPTQGLGHVLAAVERAKAEVALAGRSKAAAGGADNVGLRQQLVEELPAGRIAGGFEPHVRGVHAAEHLQS